ncbi:STAS domain-containing protein [Streptomyces sp. NPDC049936]|uniref:STAS domain-containing protein n=1 Tax=Streptomyces sp. NPDC049936 TaxID=3365599 RepID=UPI0037AC5D6A
MYITTTIDGSRARISLDGEIDFHTLPLLRAVTVSLQACVAELLWDLEAATFMDIAGLHLLFDPTLPGSSPRRTTVTGLGPQPLLTLATDLNPNIDLMRLIPAPVTPSCAPPVHDPAR